MSLRATLPVRLELCSQQPPELVAAGPHGQVARCLLHTPVGESRRPALETDRERVTRAASAMGDAEVA